jgi:hypothetical protein
MHKRAGVPFTGNLRHRDMGVVKQQAQEFAPHIARPTDNGGIDPCSHAFYFLTELSFTKEIVKLSTFFLVIHKITGSYPQKIHQIQQRIQGSNRFDPDKIEDFT